MREACAKNIAFTKEDLQLNEEQIVALTSLLEEWTMLKAEDKKRLFEKKE